MMDINQLSSKIIGAAIEVHKTLGPGLLESIYEECLSKELELREIPYKRQQELPIEYKGFKLNSMYRLDIVVAKELIVELKACDSIQPIYPVK